MFTNLKKWNFPFNKNYVLSLIEVTTQYLNQRFYISFFIYAMLFRKLLDGQYTYDKDFEDV